MSGLSINLHASSNRGIITSSRKPADASSQLTKAAATLSSQQPENAYLTSNMTVNGNQTMEFTNQNLILESLSDTTLTITVNGSLIFNDSSLSISNSTYSTVRTLNIFLNNNSHFEVANSRLIFSGEISIYHSNVTILNSIVNSSRITGSNPYSDALRITSFGSQVRIVNSTVEGLYRQSSQVEYSDTRLYSESPSIDVSEIIPMKIASEESNSSYINRILLNLSYFSVSNESNNYLLVYVNNSLRYNFTLSFNTDSSPAYDNLTLNLTGFYQPMVWFSNSTNYRLKLIDQLPGIDITNITETLMSNDTVSLYGASLYSYVLTNSTLVTLNTTFGLNSEANNISPREINPFKNSLEAYNSSIYLGDTNISSGGFYSAPFFLLHNSSLVLYGLVNVAFYTDGLPDANTNFTLSPSPESGSAGSASNQSFLESVLQRNGLSWLYAFNMAAAPYESFWNLTSEYTGDFTVKSSGQNYSISYAPFPMLPMSPDQVNMNLSVPYGTLALGNYEFISGTNSTFNLTYSSTLAGLASASLETQVSQGNKIEYSGNQNLSGFHSSGVFTLSTNAFRSLAPGNYNFSFRLTTSLPVALANDGFYNSSVYVYPNSSLYLEGINATSSSNSTTLNLTILDNGNSTSYTAELNISLKNMSSALALEKISLSPGINNFSFILPSMNASSVLYASLLPNLAPLPGSILTGLASTYEKSPATPVYSSVVLHQTGLQLSTIWGVSFAGSSYYSSGTYLNFTKDGTGTLVLLPVYGYDITRMSYALSSGNITLELNFTRAVYNVTFYNPGISSGSVWSIMINGKLLQTNSTVLVILLASGNYNYFIEDPSGYTVSDYSGILNVSSPLSIQINSSRQIGALGHAVEALHSVPVDFGIMAGVLLAISYAGWNASHTWYICQTCGSSRKKRKDACPYCGKRE